MRPSGNQKVSPKGRVLIGFHRSDATDQKNKGQSPATHVRNITSFAFGTLSMRKIGLPATTVLPAVAMAVSVSVPVPASGVNDDGRRLNDDGCWPDDDRGWLNDYRGGWANHDRGRVMNDWRRRGHHDGLRRCHPTSVVKHPLSAFLRPARLDPDVMWMRRIAPVTANPHVTVAAPFPVTGNPDVPRCRHGGTDLDLRRGWRDDDTNDLCFCLTGQQKEQGCQKECTHGPHDSVNGVRLEPVHRNPRVSLRAHMRKSHGYRVRGGIDGGLIA